MNFSNNPYEPPTIRAELAPPPPKSLFEQRLDTMELRVRSLERWLAWTIAIAIMSVGGVVIFFVLFASLTELRQANASRDSFRASQLPPDTGPSYRRYTYPGP